MNRTFRTSNGTACYSGRAIGTTYERRRRSSHSGICPHQQLRVEPQRYADWVERWLPPEQRDRRNFALVARVGGRDVALLEVDRELFLTLLEAQRGFGRSSWSRTATRRVTRFVDQVDRATEAETIGAVEDVRIRNIATDLDEQFSIQRTPSRFQI